jgi:phosphotransferase system enzyme I (PtsI)
MIPMISSIDEIIKVKQLIEEEKKQLLDAKYAVGTYKFVIMIEIPSICLMAKEATKYVDFASFGTNDLCQYLLAVDRQNPQIQEYYQNLHPGLLRVMKIAVDAFVEKGLPISVCGELGGNSDAAPILIGLGIRKLSMGKSKIHVIKKLICENNLSTFKKLAEEVLAAESEKDVLKLVSNTIKKGV